MMTGERFVVCGPPGAGKTTWCDARAKAGDLVWDFDTIASAVAYKGKRHDGGDYPWPIRMPILAMREALLRWVDEHPQGNRSVFVIVTDPGHAGQIARRLAAKRVTLGGCRG